MRAALLLLALLGTTGSTAAEIETVRVPEGGLQPQARIDARGTLHLIYFKGEPAAGDIFYLHRDPGGEFTAPLRVNSQPNTAIAVGTVRGAHLALGKGGRPHVAWMGAGAATPGMHYTRLDASGTAFEPQRNVSQVAHELDGGGSVAADPKGHVWVAWHAGNDGEEKRRVWVARSDDEGASFTAETAVSPIETGVCGCCGMRAMADDVGRLYLLYRAAGKRVHRDMTLLVHGPDDPQPAHRVLQPWELAACPMSTAQLQATPTDVLAAWEKEGQVYWNRLSDPGTLYAPPGANAGRKHPVLAANGQGATLLTWTEGTGWNQGGHLAWQVFDDQGRPTAEAGRIDNAVPVWGSAAAVALPDGSFAVIY